MKNITIQSIYTDYYKEKKIISQRHTTMLSLLFIISLSSLHSFAAITTRGSEQGQSLPPAETDLTALHTLLKTTVNAQEVVE